MKMLALLCFFSVLLAAEAVDLPSFIHVCHKGDPTLEQCFVAAVEDLRPYLVSGVPEYNIPSLEPLVMTDLIAEETAGMKIITTHVKAYGCSDFFVRKISVDMENQKYEMDVDIPALRIEAEYHVDGKILLMPIRGHGDMIANVTDLKTKAHLQGELYEKDGDTYVRYTNLQLKVHIGGGKVRLSNLFGGDKILNDVINDTINKNLDMYLKELMPVIEKALASTFLKIGNSIVESFTYEQLFPL